MIISITELRLRSVFQFPRFLKHSASSIQQAQQSKGNHLVKTKVGWLVGYTVTLWDDKESMLAFRNSHAHLAAMKEMKIVSNKYRSTNFESDSVPNWDIVKSKLKELDYKYI